MKNEKVTVKEHHPFPAVVRYHARVVGGGRVVIPEITRKLLGIEKGNIVSVKIAKIEKVDTKEGEIIIETSEPVLLEARVGNNGLITIPEEARKILGIKEGDIVEVSLYDVVKVKVGSIKKPE